jgi:probable phosphoglycerate mutase
VPAPVEVIVTTDGGARGNPGPAGIGAAVQSKSGRVLAEVSEAIGHATNNVAEYTAVVRGLERAAELGARRVRLRADSLLLVEQLNGVYKVKNPTLQRLHAEVREIARSFERVTFEHIPRERNKRADRLVNEAIDAWLAEHGDEPPPAAPPSQSSLFD